VRYWIEPAIRLLLVLLPGVLIWRGLVHWVVGRKNLANVMWRRSAIAAGLAGAVVSYACYLGVVMHLKKVHPDYWDEYVFALRWSRYNLPLSIFALVCAVVGQGSGRWLLMAGAAWLVFIWAMAFLH